MGDVIVGTAIIVGITLLAGYLAAAAIDRICMSVGCSPTVSRWTGAVGIGTAAATVAVALTWSVLGPPNQIEIQRVSVPQRLADRGYTPMVVAQQFRAAILEVIDKAETSLKAPDVQINDAASRDSYIMIRDVGFSPDTVAAWLHSLFRSGARNSAIVDITCGDREQLHLTLIYNGRVIGRLPAMPGSTDGSGPISQACQEIQPATGAQQDNIQQQVAELLKTAAQRLLEVSHTYFIAAADYRDQPERSLALSQQIVDTYPEHEEAVARAYNLQGLADAKYGKCPTWSRAFQKSIDADPALVLPYLNWGEYLLTVEKDYYGAIDKMWSAVLATPGFLSGYDVLGDAASALYFARQGPPIEYLTSLPADSTGLTVSSELADVLRMRATASGLQNHPGVSRVTDRAVAQALYRRAIPLAREAIKRDPQSLASYIDLGSAQFGIAMLQDQPTEYALDLALIPFHAAAKLQPDYLAAHFGLFLTLVQLAKLRGPNGNGYNDTMQEVKRQWELIHQEDHFTITYGQREGDYRRAMDILRDLGERFTEPPVDRATYGCDIIDFVKDIGR